MSVRVRHPASIAVLGASLCLFVASGCGDSGEAASKPVQGAAGAAGSVLSEHPDPGSITCAQLENRENYQPVFNAAVVLAETTKLRGVSRQQVNQRIYGAFHGVCAKHGAAYRPAKDAVAAVERGEFRAEVALP